MLVLFEDIVIDYLDAETLFIDTGRKYNRTRLQNIITARFSTTILLEPNEKHNYSQWRRRDGEQNENGINFCNKADLAADKRC